MQVNWTHFDVCIKPNQLSLTLDKAGLPLASCVLSKSTKPKSFHYDFTHSSGISLRRMHTRIQYSTLGTHPLIAEKRSHISGPWSSITIL